VELAGIIDVSNELKKKLKAIDLVRAAITKAEKTLANASKLPAVSCIDRAMSDLVVLSCTPLTPSRSHRRTNTTFCFEGFGREDAVRSRTEAD
jgi:hypothetical protein